MSYTGNIFTKIENVQLKNMHRNCTITAMYGTYYTLGIVAYMYT